MKSIFKAVAVVTVFSVITRTLGFFFRIFLSRKLGALGMGIYQMAASVIGVFLTLISSGIPLSTAKLVSKYIASNELKRKNRAVTTALVIAIILAIISSLIIYLLKSLWNIVLSDNRAVEIMIIMIPSLIFSAIYAVFHGALWGENNYFACGLTELVEQIIRFCLTLILLNRITDYFEATKLTAITFNIACLVSALLTLLIFLKRNRLNFSLGEYKNLLKSAAPITCVRLSNSLVQPITTLIIPNMLILSGYTFDEATSCFGVVMGMTFPLLFVPMAVIGSISMVLIPTISSLMSKNEISTIEENIKKSMSVSMFIAMLFIPLYLSVGDLIGIVLYNNAMSGILLQMGAMCVLPITLCNLTGSILNAMNLETKSFVNYLLGSLTLLVLLVILTPLLGIGSVLISHFISMSVITLLNFRKIRKTMPNLNVNFYGMILKYIIILIPSSLLGHFVSNICLNVLNNLISGIIGGGLSLISMLVLIKTLNLFDYSQLKELLKKKKKAKV